MSASDKAWKMVLVVLDDLKMGKGKIAAQCTHAGVGACRKVRPSDWRAFETSGSTTVVVKASSEAQLDALYDRAIEAGLTCCMQIDAGRTQVPDGSKTVLAIGPGPEDEVDTLTGGLKLL